jgi:hypothetical protein
LSCINDRIHERSEFLVPETVTVREFILIARKSGVPSRLSDYEVVKGINTSSKSSSSMRMVFMLTFHLRSI